MKVVYIAKPALEGKFTGQAVMTWEDHVGSQPKTFTFDTPFATRDEAMVDARKRLVDAFADGTNRNY
ncbi:hypothetical protein ASC95_01285 [Pelomonas sp. Root1217]|uniref:hypothetical protein n=1 Tax=Pelomonas sp. Root1217 TaxID=1736430 RepID=UPI0007107005|nr:hypothetical protein [Pelomonas sp. Root1217]KQV60140.1 hypothetical protein ASC95_01285 [Pelomonas sp. Root1217]